MAEMLAPCARRGHAHAEDGRHGEGPAGRDRHGAGPGGVHQVRPGKGGGSAVVPDAAGMRSPRAASAPGRPAEDQFLSNARAPQRDGHRAVAGARHQHAAGNDPDRRQEHHPGRRRHALPPGGRQRCASRSCAPTASPSPWAGRPGNPVPFYPIPLQDKDGNPNYSMIAAYAALTGKTVNIADAYTAEGFDFSGTRNFDKQDRLPLEVLPHGADEEPRGRDHRRAAADQRRRSGERARSPRSATADQRLAESLASQAAIALTNRLLINQLEELFESLIKLINTAIDDKSPYTGGHCKRVPMLTMMLAEAAHEAGEGPLAGFRMSETRPLRAQDRGPAARLREGHDARARGGQGDQAARRSATASSSWRRASRCSSATPRSTCCARAPGPSRRETRRARSAPRRRTPRSSRSTTTTASSCAACNIGGERMRPEDQARVRADRALHLGERARGPEPNFLTPEEELRTCSIRLRHAHRRGARDHQPPHRGDDPDARGAALAPPPRERAGVRGRPPRAHGRRAATRRG